MGFSDDQRPDVNSGYFILLQYKPSTLLEYLFYWTAERPSLHGAWHQWIPCEVVRLTASELSGWLPCFRFLAVMWSGWLLPSCQADCLTPGWSNGVRFTQHSHPHLSSCTCVTAHGTGYANRPVGRYSTWDSHQIHSSWTSISLWWQNNPSLWLSWTVSIPKYVSILWHAACAPSDAKLLEGGV